MQPASFRSGRISIVLLASVVSIALVAGLFLASGPSPKVAAEEFMSALATGDVDKLTDLWIVQNKSKEEIHKEWEMAVKYGQTYLFSWDIPLVKQEGDTATARVEITENPMGGGSYAQPRPLQLVKVDGKWKVDIAEATRDMYPYLPQ